MIKYVNFGNAVLLDLNKQYLSKLPVGPRSVPLEQRRVYIWQLEPAILSLKDVYHLRDHPRV